MFEIELYGRNRDDCPYHVKQIEEAFGVILSELNQGLSAPVEFVEGPDSSASFYRVRDCVYFYPGTKVWRLSLFWGIHEKSEETTFEICKRLWADAETLSGIALIAGEELVYPSEVDIVSQKPAREVRKLCGAALCIRKHSVDPEFLFQVTQSKTQYGKSTARED